MSLEEIKKQINKIFESDNQGITYTKKYYQSQHSGYIIAVTDSYCITVISPGGKRYGVLLFDSLLNIQSFTTNSSHLKGAREHYESIKDTISYIDLKMQEEKVKLEVYKKTEPLRQEARDNAKRLREEQTRRNILTLKRKKVTGSVNKILKNIDCIENSEDQERAKSLLKEIEALILKSNST